MTSPCTVPVGSNRLTLEVTRSRFIATVLPCDSVESAKTSIAQVKHEMPDASHHVYAFRIGCHNTVTEGMSDDGEPSGTAGAPVMAVVRGSQLGDIIVIITRYYGGTKLGTGGLVRAYTQSAQEVLRELPTQLKLEWSTLGLEIPYPLYNSVQRTVSAFQHTLLEEQFQTTISLIVSIPKADVSRFSAQIIDLSHGSIVPFVL